MREFNPSVETPGDILYRVQSLRRTPDLHIAMIEDELARARNKLAVFAGITNPSFAVQTLQAYALRTKQLLEKEKASWYDCSTPGDDRLKS